MKIVAIILDGRHGGFVYPDFEYSPTINIPIVNKNQISIGEEYDKSVRIGDEIQYKECFRSVDKKCVMYSIHGVWQDVNARLLYQLKPTYPISLF